MNLWHALRRPRRYTLDPDAIARALAAPLLADYDPEILERTGTVQHLRQQYMQLVARFGLPPAACVDVADRAWAFLAAARPERTADTTRPFAFYE